MNVGEFLTNLLGAFKGDLAALILVVLLVVVGYFASRALAAFRNSEFYRSNKDRIDLVEKMVTSFIFLAAFGDVDLTEWQDKSDKRVADGLSYIDPRMLYVVDKVELFANEKLGLNLEFDDILAIAERKYQELKNDVNSPIGGF